MDEGRPLDFIQEFHFYSSINKLHIYIYFLHIYIYIYDIDDKIYISIRINRVI